MHRWHDVAMKLPSWVEQLSAWSTFAAAALTFALLLMALAAWRTGKATLKASREANEQARRDSIEQTRPYVFVEIAPGLSGTEAWDIRIVNAGKSAARQMTLDYDNWSDQPDDVASSLHKLFDTPRTLPPGCSVRAFWRLEGTFDDGSTEAGGGRSGTITVSYTSDDPSRPRYDDAFDVMIDSAGLWPVGEAGPNPDGLSGEAKKFYLLGQALVRRVAELKR